MIRSEINFHENWNSKEIAKNHSISYFSFETQLIGLQCFDVSQVYNADMWVITAETQFSRYDKLGKIVNSKFFLEVRAQKCVKYLRHQVIHFMDFCSK